jgi:hypothetical protein
MSSFSLMDEIKVLLQKMDPNEPLYPMLNVLVKRVEMLETAISHLTTILGYYPETREFAVKMREITLNPKDASREVISANAPKN